MRSANLGSRQCSRRRAGGVAPPPWVDGHTLEKLGLPRGPAYKAILDKIYYAQLNGDLTTPAEAKALAKRLIRDAGR